MAVPELEPLLLKAHDLERLIPLATLALAISSSNRAFSWLFLVLFSLFAIYLPWADLGGLRSRLLLSAPPLHRLDRDPG